MKNRFGPDGKTYVATINTKNGFIDISDLEWSIDSEMVSSKPSKFTETLSPREKEIFLFWIFLISLGFSFFPSLEDNSWGNKF